VAKFTMSMTPRSASGHRTRAYTADQHSGQDGLEQERVASGRPPGASGRPAAAARSRPGAGPMGQTVTYLPSWTCTMMPAPFAFWPFSSNWIPPRHDQLVGAEVVAFRLLDLLGLVTGR